MLIQEAIKQLHSLKYILEQISQQDYQKSLVTLKNASIGKHVRHIIEFYECLFITSQNDGVNYDSRNRNMLLEENVQYTLGYISEIVDVIGKIKANKRIILTSSYQAESISMETSLYREITYNIEHTVHHLAIISIAIPIHFDYIKMQPDFGYADSTIQFLKTQKVEA